MTTYIVRSYCFIECEVIAEDENEASEIFSANHPDFKATGNDIVRVLECEVSQSMGNEIYDSTGECLLLQDW